METFVHISGWIGTALIVWAYYLVSNNKIDPASQAYQLMNLVGSIGVGVNVFYQRAWPAVALEIIWGMIAMAALLRLKQKRY